MFGKYTLSYQPGEESSLDPSITMSFSGEADLPEILAHFENFLRATGHPLNFDQELQLSPSSETTAEPEGSFLPEEFAKDLNKAFGVALETLKELGLSGK
jgi:hypothetical protein